MSYLVGQRFSPLELVGPGGPPLAAMSDSVALARELELALEVTPVRLSNGFFDSVMAAIAAENCSQRERSANNCFLPAVVKR